MDKHELEQVVNFIRTHKPQADDMDTINVALHAAGIEGDACYRKDLLNPDDVWLMPEDKAYEFAGVKGQGWVEGFATTVIEAIKEAVKYAKEHADELADVTNEISLDTPVKDLNNYHKFEDINDVDHFELHNFDNEFDYSMYNNQNVNQLPDADLPNLENNFDYSEFMNKDYNDFSEYTGRSK